MAYKFEKLEVWNMALDYIDQIYKLAEMLPKSEDYNLRSQIIRAATSVALNIAEGSTGLSDAEQGRFIGIAVRSLMETVACLHIIKRRGYCTDSQLLRALYADSEKLAVKLQAFRKTFRSTDSAVRDEEAGYLEPDPFLPSITEGSEEFKSMELNKR